MWFKRFQRPLVIAGLLLASLTLTVDSQSSDRGKGGYNPALPSMLRGDKPVPGTPQAGPTQSAARNFLTQAQAYMAEGRTEEAREALRTAIRLEPMNLEAWGLYDYAVETHYVSRAREEKVNPVVERDLRPLFSIDRVESYKEFGSLFLVGEIKNLSGTLKNNVELTGTLLDDQGTEIRRASRPLSLKNRGLFPNESSLFEIPFTDPPPGVKSFRVRVSSFE